MDRAMSTSPVIFARAHLRETMLELPEVPALWSHIHWAKYNFAKKRLDLLVTNTKEMKIKNEKD